MSLKNLKPQSTTKNHITRNTFRHCRVRFCWTTFLETAVYIKPPFKLVSFAAVIRVVTQWSWPLTAVSGGEALRDDSNNGCGGDYVQTDFLKMEDDRVKV